MDISSISNPMNTTIVSTSSPASSASTLQKNVRKMLNENNVMVQEILNSTYNTNMEIIKNFAPSKKETELREARKTENIKKYRAKKETEKERLAEEIEKERMNEELAEKMENIV